MYQHVTVPEGGQKDHGQGRRHAQRPDQPIIPFIEGDGVGVDITPVMPKVVDAAVGWRPMAAAARSTGWRSTPEGHAVEWPRGGTLPDETVQVLPRLPVSIKGPADDAGGGGIRSLNVALRQRWTSTSACARCAG